MGQYLIDTNSVSSYLTENFSDAAMSFLDEVTNEIPNISVITEIEILSWKTSASVESIIKDFVYDSTVYSVTDDVVNICVELLRKRNIKTPDAIIAATAIVHGLALITTNEKDFSNFKSLAIINPAKL